jgi:O-acetyl-ADP-ribose deacetylase (regulator of RNase III)
MPLPLKTFATYKLMAGGDSRKRLVLKLAKGSVLAFASHAPAAIVNAANVECLGGGGVDGAITDAGGPTLAHDRLQLPILETIRYETEEDDDDDNFTEVRCRLGGAVITGPGDYGTLHVPYIIHAVGPNYHHFAPSERREAHALLYSAYASALDVAAENGLQVVAFSLLSAGVFRGSCSMKTVIGIGLQSGQKRARTAMEAYPMFTCADSAISNAKR